MSLLTFKWVGGLLVGDFRFAVFIVDKSISLPRTFFGFQFRIDKFQNQRIKTFEEFLLNLWVRFRLLLVTIPIFNTY